jgi:hypothetical protein
MPRTSELKSMHASPRQRFWFYLAGAIAFLLAALWAKPVW